MGKQGWLTIRKVPELDSAESGEYHRILRNFFKKYRNCPSCKGLGYKIKNPGEVVAETTIKFLGIPEIEKLSMQGISITDVIREILERQVWNRRRCKVCKGSRFVLREGKEDESASKKEKKGIR